MNKTAKAMAVLHTALCTTGWICGTMLFTRTFASSTSNFTGAWKTAI
jgi:hypothetical protein